MPILPLDPRPTGRRMPPLAALALSLAIALALALGLASFAGCGKSQPRVDHGGLEYPTFELFTSSRAFPLLAREAGTQSLSQIAGIAQLLDEQMRRPGRSGGRIHASATDESAELGPRVPYQELSTYRIVPLVFMRLEAAWEEPHWSVVDVTEAVQGAALLRELTGAPEARFVQGDDAQNKQSLEELVRWFHGLEDHPELLAAMIFTLDTGPFAGIPLGSEPLAATKPVRPFGDGFDLRIASLAGEPEPCALQCVREGRVCWTSVLSGQPFGRVAGAEIADMDAVDLGRWGWLVVVRVQWTQGEQHAYVYLDREGGLRFYFLSQ